MRRVLRFCRAAAKALLLVCGVLFLLQWAALTAFVLDDMRRDERRSAEAVADLRAAGLLE